MEKKNNRMPIAKKPNLTDGLLQSIGASPVVPVKDSSIDTVQAIATTISAVSTPATVCPRCSARFSWVGAMLVHLRSNECGSLPKFTCPLPSCNFTTRHQRNIKRHVVRLHPELDYRWIRERVHFPTRYLPFPTFPLLLTLKSFLFLRLNQNTARSVSEFHRGFFFLSTFFFVSKILFRLDRFFLLKF